VCVYMFTFLWWCVLSIPRLCRGHFPDHRNVRRVGATARQRLRSCQTAWHQHPPPFSPHVHMRDLLHIDCQPPTQMCHVNNEISFQADALCRYPDQLLICRSNCFSIFWTGKNNKSDDATWKRLVFIDIHINPTDYLDRVSLCVSQGRLNKNNFAASRVLKQEEEFEAGSAAWCWPTTPAYIEKTNPPNTQKKKNKMKESAV
jgi:hypothetical protein